MGKKSGPVRIQRVTLKDSKKVVGITSAEFEFSIRDTKVLKRGEFSKAFSKAFPKIDVQAYDDHGITCWIEYIWPSTKTAKETLTNVIYGGIYVDRKKGMTMGELEVMMARVKIFLAKYGDLHLFDLDEWKVGEQRYGMK